MYKRREFVLVKFILIIVILGTFDLASPFIVDNHTCRNVFIFKIIFKIFAGLVGTILFWKIFVVEIKQTYSKLLHHEWYLIS